MDKKSKILIIVFILLILGSVAATYYRIFVKRDYIISAQMDCDPLSENCYVWKCDPAVDGEETCTGDPEEDIWYYKILNRKALNIPLCDPNDEECEALTCPEGEAECEMTNCNPETEECMTPERYLEENPDALSEDEESECAEDDAECLAEEGSTECEEGDGECTNEEAGASEDAEENADGVEAPENPEEVPAAQTTSSDLTVSPGTPVAE